MFRNIKELTVRYKCPHNPTNGYIDKKIKTLNNDNCILDFRGEFYEIYSITVDKCPLCKKKHVVTHFRNI